MTGVEGAMVLAIGAAVGSFLNVAILRTRAHRPVTGRSSCPNCHRTLVWWELIPILSWVALRGRCRTCGHQLSWQYPIVETLTAAAFVDMYLWFGWSWLTLASWVVVAAMIMIAVYDTRWASIPDAFTAVLAGGAIGVVGLSRADWTNALIGGVAGAGFFGAQYVLSRRRWVGSGDILLGAALGVLLGWRMLGLALFIAYMVGTVIAVAMLIRQRLKLSSAMPFGPFLLIGGYLAWHWGEAIVNWYFAHALFL